MSPFKTEKPMPTNLAFNNQSAYNFSEPIRLSENTIGDGLFDELVGSKAFQRLKDIRFLGGIDYLLIPFPNGAKRNTRYTRFQHSIGVARLGLLYCDAAALPFKDRRLVYTAALLHDIGHAPLSHSLEPVFKEAFGIDHHKATEDIITGRSPLGSEVLDALRRNKVDVERLIAILDGTETCYHGFFSGPINFDTIEGILRARAYNRSEPGLLCPDAVVDAAFRRLSKNHLSAVDEFWSYKDYIYCHVINSKTGALVDHACQTYMRSCLDNITKDDHFIKEKTMFKKLPGLRELLRSPSFEKTMMMRIEQPIRYNVRNFFINPKADFFSRDDKGRYLQSKKECAILPDNIDSGEPTNFQPELSL